MPPITEINARYPQALQRLDSLFAVVPLADWKVLLRWHLLRSAAPSLPERFVAADFDFQRRLSGASRRQDREAVCLEDTRRAMGDLIAVEYVARHVPTGTRPRAQAMVENIVAALRERIATLEWMSDSTKREALAKVDSLDMKIAYPDSWRDYSGLVVQRGTLLENRRRERAFQSQRGWSVLHDRVDRREWRATPTSNAGFYQPPYNDVTVGAPMLQPPIFDPSGDEATNYGAAGAVIAHEITHAFDVTGRHFDATGSSRDWWAASDAAHYTEMSRALIEQYNALPLDSAHRVNGATTLGENIADLGGVKLAYLAMQRALRGKPRQIIDGFTPEQRFFLAFARVHRTIHPPGVAWQSAAYATHAPPKWRVNGALANLPAFASAWGCAAGSPMARVETERVTIW